MACPCESAPTPSSASAPSVSSSPGVNASQPAILTTLPSGTPASVSSACKSGDGCATIPRFPAGVSYVLPASSKVVFSN